MPINARGLYIIWDKVTQDINGMVTVHQHEAAAIRFFSDVAGMENSPIIRHPQDYCFKRIGWIDDQGHVVPEDTIILEGATWYAAATAKHQPSSENGA